MMIWFYEGAQTAAPFFVFAFFSPWNQQQNCFHRNRPSRNSSFHLGILDSRTPAHLHIYSWQHQPNSLYV